MKQLVFEPLLAHKLAHGAFGSGQEASKLLSYSLGALAQLGEHLLCKQGVAGSIPVRSIR